VILNAVARKENNFGWTGGGGGQAGGGQAGCTDNKKKKKANSKMGEQVKAGGRKGWDKHYIF